MKSATSSTTGGPRRAARVLVRRAGLAVPGAAEAVLAARGRAAHAEVADPVERVVIATLAAGAPVEPAAAVAGPVRAGDPAAGPEAVGAPAAADRAGVPAAVVAVAGAADKVARSG